MFPASHPDVFSRIALLLMLAAAVLAPAPAAAHDPSAWGGLFRTRDFGANWFPADAGLFIGGALGVAVHPADPAQMLYGTDARLLRTKNGGRDWATESAPAMIGAVFAVVFDADGEGALASTGTRIFRFEPKGGWSDVFAPAGAAPARSFVRSTLTRDRVYLAGAHGLFISDDRGRTWMRSGDGVLPDSAVVSLLVVPGTPEKLHAVVDGDIWTSADGGGSWSRRASGLPAGKVDAISADAAKPDRLWAAATSRIYVSDDAGFKWSGRGNAMSDTDLSVRGIAVSADEKIMVASTHRGVFRSADGGQAWGQIESTLPVHLESGLLLRDPQDPSTLYAGFSLSPYGETWRRAEQGGSLLAQTDPVSLAGGLAFLVVLILCGAAATRWLMRRSRGAYAAARQSSSRNR